MENVGLVLSGGGARAAYQVGALRALVEVLGARSCPFNILTGLSAGAINSVQLACGADDFPSAVQELVDTWLSLEPHSVYRTDAVSLSRLGARWLKDVTTGGILGESHSNYLLDTEPLRELLTERLRPSHIPAHIASGALRAVAVSATNYATGTIMTFYDAVPEQQPWLRNERIGVREAISVEHVMATAAIPMFFPPVSIGGRSFGDGGLRMTAPVSSAIHLGADKILAIGIRHARSEEEIMRLNHAETAPEVSAAEIAGVLLDALFLDSLDDDLARLQRINRTLGFVPEEARNENPDLLRRIPALLLHPSQDLGRLAADEYDKFPAMLRHLLRGIGATGASGWDLMSYLAFQPGYVRTLMELGYHDTIARRDELQEFFAAPADGETASEFASRTKPTTQEDEEGQAETG